jgi:predicted translin family RNA/ssDNA-binding protein
MSIIPTPPQPFVSADRHSAFLSHIAELEASLSARHEERSTAFSHARAVQNTASLAVHRRHAGDATGAAAKLKEAATGLDKVLPHRQNGDEDGGLSAAAQQVAVAQIFEAFLATGTLGARPAPSAAWTLQAPAPKRVVGAKSSSRPADDDLGSYTDDEWLGALMSSAHEIGRYAASAATRGDTRSVQAARAVVSALHDSMAAFDLRNGNLRRTFDSIKYVVRRLEDTTYELSLFPPTQDGAPPAPATRATEASNSASDRASTDAAPPPTTAPAPPPTDTAPLLVDAEALEAARDAYATLDAAREAVIKACREPQKLAKQAIAALHRDDRKGAARSLGAAREGAISLLETNLAAQPSLRGQGAVRAMLEELAEAALFEAWLGAGEAPSAAAGEGSHAGASEQGQGRVLLLGDAEELLGSHLQPAEYLGAMCDLVGEIGRYAVRRATERDAEAVRESLASALAVQSAVMSLGNHAPRGLHKKGDALRTAVRKMETLLYELSLVERSGRVREAPPEMPEPSGGGGGDADES